MLGETEYDLYRDNMEQIFSDIEGEPERLALDLLEERYDGIELFYDVWPVDVSFHHASSSMCWTTSGKLLANAYASTDRVWLGFYDKPFITDGQLDFVNKPEIDGLWYIRSGNSLQVVRYTKHDETLSNKSAPDKILSDYEKGRADNRLVEALTRAVCLAIPGVLKNVTLL